MGFGKGSNYIDKGKLNPKLKLNLKERNALKLDSNPEIYYDRKKYERGDNTSYYYGKIKKKTVPKCIKQHSNHFRSAILKNLKSGEWQKVKYRHSYENPKKPLFQRIMRISQDEYRTTIADPKEYHKTTPYNKKPNVTTIFKKSERDYCKIGMNQKASYHLNHSKPRTSSCGWKSGTYTLPKKFEVNKKTGHITKYNPKTSYFHSEYSTLNFKRVPSKKKNVESFKTVIRDPMYETPDNPAFCD